MPATRKSSSRRRSTSLKHLVSNAVSMVGRTGHSTARGAVDFTASAVRGTVNTVRDTADVTLSNTGKSVANTVDFASDFSRDIVDALETVVSGLINGASTVVDTTGKVTEHVLTDLFDVKATHVFKGAGELARSLANNIGGVVRKVPAVGNATGFVVESVGGGVYHVILSVGKLIGSTSRRLGSVAKKSTDLVVFTLTAGRDQVKDTAVSVNDIVDRVANTVALRNGSKTLKSVGGRRKAKRYRQR